MSTTTGVMAVCQRGDCPRGGAPYRVGSGLSTATHCSGVCASKAEATTKPVRAAWSYADAGGGR